MLYQNVAHMNIKLSLRHKIQLIITSITVVVFALAIGYLTITEQRISYQNQTSLIESQTEKFGNQIKVYINEDFAVVRTLALAFKTFEFLPYQQYQQWVNEIYGHVFNGNPEFYQLWDSWEFRVIDSTWNKPTGRISNTLVRENGVVKQVTAIRSLDGDNEFYAKDKALARELVSEIYVDAFSEKKNEIKIMTAFEAPIMKNNTFVGLVGVDVTLDKFQEIVGGIQIENLQGSHAFLISHDGKYAGHPKTEKLNTLINVNPAQIKGFDLIQKMNIGKPFSLVHPGKERRFVSYYPIKIGRTDTYWCLGISVPESSIREIVNQNIYMSIMVGIVGILITALVIYLIVLSITRPIQAVTNQLTNLEQGRISINNELNINTGDEIQKMAEALNRTVSQLNIKNEFAKELGLGNLDYNYTLPNNEDELGISLLEMQQSLVSARNEENKRKQADEINDFVSKAITETSDLFRKHNQDLKELTFSTLQYLIDYLRVAQAGVYIKTDETDEVYYELISAIAFGRDKLLDKKILEEEGLVGRCGYEGLTIYLTEIPDDYVDIKSGLGGANPRVILLVPLKSASEVVGVIEFISFNEIKDYEISMVEQIAGNLAATIGNVRVNQRTERLLTQSQYQAEDLARQEQEMRQNIEEMKATQEESHQRQFEMKALHEAVNDIAYLAEFDMEGYLIDINKNLETLLATTKDQVIGKQQGTFSDDFDQNRFDEMWERLRSGESVINEQCLRSGLSEVWLLETYKPIINADGEPYKIINIAIDITHSKTKQS